MHIASNKIAQPLSVESKEWKKEYFLGQTKSVDGMGITYFVRFHDVFDSIDGTHFTQLHGLQNFANRLRVPTGLWMIVFIVVIVDVIEIMRLADICVVP